MNFVGKNFLDSDEFDNIFSDLLTKNVVDDKLSKLFENFVKEDEMKHGWIGVDLDGTLAYYDQWRGIDHVGLPIIRMVDRVNDWLNEGKKVKIMTARVYGSTGDELNKICEPIRKFCVDNFGVVLDITCVKDFAMIELWDDRAVGVIPNMGIGIGVK